MLSRIFSAKAGGQLQFEKYICFVCKKPTIQKCNGCHDVFYCCADHQKMHWPAHKTYCIEKRRRMGEDFGEPGMPHIRKKGGFGNFGEGGIEDLYGEPMSSER